MNDRRLLAEAVVLILRSGDRILVIKRGPGAIPSGYWCPPSGRIEPGETQQEAVIREVAEELGVVARPVAKIWECPSDDGEFTLHWWLAQVADGELHPDPNEVADVQWVTAEEFTNLRPTFAGDSTAS